MSCQKNRNRVRQVAALQILSALCLAVPVTVQAQRANENAVAEASDAFGTAVGREVIGLYTTTSARGFNPSEAGNLRIAGLYFDQISQATPVARIVRGSTVHVGISAQGFPFYTHKVMTDDLHIQTLMIDSEIMSTRSLSKRAGPVDDQC